MNIVNLAARKKTGYSSNVYLILGGSDPDDINTLIDVGNDITVLKRLEDALNDQHQKPIEQVILTHGHIDHTALLPLIRDRFALRVYAHPISLDVDTALQDGQELRCGDRWFEVIYTPGHSQDSICLYDPEDSALFAGDTPVIIRWTNGAYDEQFAQTLDRLCQLKIKTIYQGHGDPITRNAQDLLHQSLKNVRKTMSKQTWRA